MKYFFNKIERKSRILPTLPSGENRLKSVDNFEFLTVSTGFSTGAKISDNISFSLHKIFGYFLLTANFLPHNHFADKHFWTQKFVLDRDFLAEKQKTQRLRPTFLKKGIDFMEKTSYNG